MQARKKYINNHPKKIELANLILEHRADKKCITFSNTIAMAERIGYGKVYSGKDSVKKGRVKLEEFIGQPTGVINSIRRLTEGFNDPTISVAVVLGFDSSKTRKTQSIGRVIRAFEGKKAEVFNLVLKGTVEETWFANSNTNANYITIDEENLINVLNHTEFTKKKNKVTKMKFRF
jgi:superfamily II DNA or RNA helicase